MQTELAILGGFNNNDWLDSPSKYNSHIFIVLQDDLYNYTKTIGAILIADQGRHGQLHATLPVQGTMLNELVASTSLAK